MSLLIIRFGYIIHSHGIVLFNSHKWSHPLMGVTLNQMTETETGMVGLLFSVVIVI